MKSTPIWFYIHTWCGITTHAEDSNTIQVLGDTQQGGLNQARNQVSPNERKSRVVEFYENNIVIDGSSVIHKVRVTFKANIHLPAGITKARIGSPSM